MHSVDWQHFSLQLEFCLPSETNYDITIAASCPRVVCPSLSLSPELTLKADWHHTSKKEFHIKENQRDQSDVQRGKKKQVPWNYRFIPSLLRQTPDNVIQKHRKIVQCSCQDISSQVTYMKGPSTDKKTSCTK